MSGQLTKSTLLVSAFILSGCGSNALNDVNDTTPNYTPTFSLQEKQFVHNLFLTEYLWYEDVAMNVNFDSFSTPQSLVNALKVTPPDIWSFTMTADQYEDYVNQKTVGFGFGYTQDMTIYLVRINAPAYDKLYRGDQIIAINGMDATSSRLQLAASNLNTPTTFTVIRDGNTLEIDVTPKEYTFKVTQGKIISQGSKQVGYLRYDSFRSASVTELEEEFTKFKTANIDELIIDLRYNGGGSIAVASTLLDNITNAYPGQRQGYLDWNANYTHKNDNFYFSDEIEPNDLNMKRVIFLVTKDSASASELVISALKPYLGESNIITIGTNTHGKNSGMSGRTYGENYYFIINFYVRNDAGETTSFDGIPATCSAEDDITRKMGDEEESMLKSALYYIENGSCL